jgi:hypothetical protein
VGWIVRLVDQHGAVVDEAASTNDASLARAQESPDLYPRIAEIDPYGDTIFNKLQIPALLNELEVVLDETDNRDEQQWLLDLRALAERCRDATHLYLKLLGD